MYLFLFLLLPLCFTAYCFLKKDKKVIPPAVIGFLAAVLVCAIKLFFMSAHRIVPYSFSQNFVYYLVRQSFLPTVILYGLFFAVSRDSLEYKINSYFPLVICFYMVYLPYNEISGGDAIIPAFLIFVKPLIYAAMITQTALSMNIVLKAINQKKYWLIAAAALIILVYLIAPAVIESMYMTGFNFVLVIILSVVYCLVTAAYLALKVLIFRNKKY